MNRLRVVLAALALLALVALGAAAAVDFRGAMHGWLLGFVFVSLAPAGGLILVMIGELTGAPWRRDFAPQLQALAGAAPWLWLLGAPIAFLLGLTYPWASPGGSPDHLRVYLSTGPFLARAAVALAGWTALAWLVRRQRVTQLVAALGLVFQAIYLTIIPNDWVLSLQPAWTTTDIGMDFLTLEVAFAAAAILLFGPGRPSKSADDMAGFLIAGVLGVMYLTFVAYLIDWYGDLPDKVSWWLTRTSGDRWIEVCLAFAAGSIAFMLLGFGRHYRLAGAAAMAGVAIYCVWLVTPDLGGWAWLAAPGGLLAEAALIALTAPQLFLGGPAGSAAHV